MGGDMNKLDEEFQMKNAEALEAKPVIELSKESFSRREERDLPVASPTDATPMSMLAVAVQRGMDVATIKDLMQLQKDWEANEARKAFNAAFAAFKAESVQIIKGTLIESGPLKGKKHADLFDIVSATAPMLSKHGLSTSWKLTKDEKDWMEMTCTLSHVAGHSESVAMGGAPDEGPGRNAIQARVSVKTYLERYTLTAILGLAASDSDDDGAGGGAAGLDQEEVKKFEDTIEILETRDQADKLWKQIAEACDKANDLRSHTHLKELLRAKSATFKVSA
jgi:hypothetical protein